ncbi:MAG: hypothetical protein FJY97_17365 [candidate division Zixibacteria bacterium]|nr:hypothetical protein [candidate division Zixibacteria bacterium]
MPVHLCDHVAGPVVGERVQKHIRVIHPAQPVAQGVGVAAGDDARTDDVRGEAAGRSVGK